MDNVTRRDVIRGAAVAGLVGVFASGAALGAEEQGNKAAVKFEGKWKYQSYRPDPGFVAADPYSPRFVHWSPPGVVTIDEGGTTGTLELAMPSPRPPLKLALKIQIAAGSPATVSISAVMMLPGDKQFTNELRGWLVPAKLGQEVGKDNPLVVRGSIVQTSGDIAPVPQPIYTTGFFVLEPLK